MNIEIRRSTKNDTNAVRMIMYECFGARPERDYLWGTKDGRHLLAICDGQVVGMTGLCPSSKYGGPEVDYTAVLPQYRRQGIMDALITELLKEQTEPVYYSAWRFAGHSRSTPQTILEKHGFELVKYANLKWEVPVNCDHTNNLMCKGWCEEKCHCYEDLWIWRPDEHK